MEQNEKPVKVKGVATEGDATPTPAIMPKITKSSTFADVTPGKERLAKLAEIATAPTANYIPGYETGIDKRAVDSLYATIDLAKAIPDQYEREKYIAYNKDKLVQLMTPDKYGVRFTKDLQDYAVFKEKKYDQQVKKFLDDLDENQGFLEALGLTAAKLVGKTAVAVGGVIPVVYGIGSALFNWDRDKIFNNTAFDAWEVMDQGLDKHLAVYGGYDYTQGDKGFFARMADNPMKSINADIIPAASFVAGAIITEMLATAAAPFTGGTTVAANTARLGAQATNLFSKGMRTIRGLDKVGDFANMRNIAELTKVYRAGIGTATSMVRSAGYESALMARSASDKTYEQLVTTHRTVNGTEPTENQKALYREKADDAGELTWAANIPLVGFSNMIQFSKVFAGGLKVNKALSRLNPLKLTGTSAVGGKVIANADKFKPWQRTAILGGTALKSGITEGFEEFAQGAIENGTADYFTSKYTIGAKNTAASYIDSIATAARNYVGTTEGQDSITIGALMGMLGMRLPVKMDEQGNVKFSLRGQHFGGAYQEIKDVKAKIKESRETAEYIKNNSIDPILKANFDNMLSNITSQAEMDNAILRGDNFTFKNKEFEQTFSHVSTKIKQGIGDTVIQEIEALEQLSLEDFNTQFAHPGVKEFTEETKKEALSKFKNQTKNIIKAHEQVETAFNDTKHLVDFARTDFKAIDNPEFFTAIKEQMAFLLASSDNLEMRETELQNEVREKTNGKISPDIVNKLVAQVAKLTPEGKAEFINSGNELYKAALENWKEEDINSYNTYVDQVKPLLKDLLQIKAKRAESTSLYRALFTKKGANNFATFQDELQAKFNEDVLAKLQEAIAEKLKRAKSSERVVKTASDEASISGSTPAVDAKLAEESDAVDAALRAELNSTDPEAVKDVADESELFDKVDSAAMVALLQKNPTLFAEILNRLANEGNEIYGLSNIDQLDEILATNPDAEALIAGTLAAILKENAAAKALKPVVQTFANPLDKDQPAPKNSDADNFEDIFGAKLDEVVSIFTKGTNVSEVSIVPITHDKNIVNGKVQRDPATGRFVKKVTDQKVDTATINSPEFLSNEELANNIKEATLKIADNDYNKTNPSVEDIAIDLYHGDVFIGRLPAFKPGMDASLLELRKAVVAQEIEKENKTVSKPTVKKPIENVELKLNVESTTDGLQTFLSEDNEVVAKEETEIVTILPDDKNPSFKIDKGILRIRIPSLDVAGRSGGGTYVNLKVPDGFDSEVFAKKLATIRHDKNRTDIEGKATAKVVNEVRQAIQDSLFETVLDPSIIENNFEAIVQQLNIKTDCK
jgi:L-rhamnose mutarotase